MTEFLNNEISKTYSKLNDNLQIHVIVRIDIVRSLCYTPIYYSSRIVYGSMTAKSDSAAVSCQFSVEQKWLSCVCVYKNDLT